MFHVFFSESTGTGFAPTYVQTFAVATNVRSGIMTSSPLPMPRAARARCNAVVPLLTLTPCPDPQNAANFSSNFGMYFPRLEIQLLSMQSRTYSFSFPFRYGSATGINVPIAVYWQNSL